MLMPGSHSQIFRFNWTWVVLRGLVLLKKSSPGNANVQPGLITRDRCHGGIWILFYAQWEATGGLHDTMPYAFKRHAGCDMRVDCRTWDSGKRNLSETSRHGERETCRRHLESRGAAHDWDRKSQQWQGKANIQGHLDLKLKQMSGQYESFIREGWQKENSEEWGTESRDVLWPFCFPSQIAERSSSRWDLVT